MTEFTESNFKDATASGISLVDFWAEWCGPCRMLTPIVQELSTEYDGKATIGKVNVDDAAALAQQFGVASIPTIVVLKDGEEVNRFVGVTSKDNLAKALDEAIG
jgi:thioredoxin 1